MILARYRHKPESHHLLWWGIGIVTYGVGTLIESLVTLFGWQEALFKAWYIAGALLGGAPLAIGSIYLLLGERAGRIAVVFLLTRFSVSGPVTGGRSIALDGNREPGTGNRQGNAAPGSRLPAPGVIWKGEHDRTRRIAGVAYASAMSMRLAGRMPSRLISRPRSERGVEMFAALYAPSLPAAALVDVARAFTPRFEQLGAARPARCERPVAPVRQRAGARGAPPRCAIETFAW